MNKRMRIRSSLKQSCIDLTNIILKANYLSAKLLEYRCLLDASRSPCVPDKGHKVVYNNENLSVGTLLTRVPC